LKSLIRIAVTIGQDIVKAFEFAAPLVAIADPPLAPVLMEVSQVVAILEARGQKIDQGQLSSIVQAVVAAHVTKLAPSEPANTVATGAVISGQ